MTDETDSDDVMEQVAERGDEAALEVLQETLNDLEGTEPVAEMDGFDLMNEGGLHLDQAWQSVHDHVDYDRAPVRVIIEPEIPHPDDHHYRMKIEDLESFRHSDGKYEYRPEGIEGRLQRLADVIRQMDCLVPSEIAEVDDFDSGRRASSDNRDSESRGLVGVHPDPLHLTFEVEADVVSDATRTGNPQYQIPSELRYELQKWDASITEAAFNPEGDGWGEPTYCITVELDT